MQWRLELLPAQVYNNCCTARALSEGATTAQSLWESELAQLRWRWRVARQRWQALRRRTRRRPPTCARAVRDARLQTDAACVLAWLTIAVRALRGHVDMAHYAVARGRPGRVHRVSPPADDDARERADMRRAAERLRTGRLLQRGADR